MLRRDKKFIYSFTILLVLTIIFGISFLFLVSRISDSYIVDANLSPRDLKPARTIIGGQEESYELDSIDADFVFPEYMIAQPFKVPSTTFYDEFGQEYQFSDYLGNFVILYFWASWCVGCNQELMQLQQLNADLEFEKIHDLEIIPLSIDQKSVYELNSFYKSLGIDTLPIFHDDGRSIANILEIRSLPSTLLINKDGMILAKIRDHLDWTSSQLVHELMILKGEDESYQRGQELIDKKDKYKNFKEEKERSDNEEESDIMESGLVPENRSKGPLIIN